MASTIKRSKLLSSTKDRKRTGPPHETIYPLLVRYLKTGDKGALKAILALFRGPTGPPGCCGEDGRDGDDGEDGAPGSAGARGADGKSVDALGIVASAHAEGDEFTNTTASEWKLTDAGEPPAVGIEFVSPSTFIPASPGIYAITFGAYAEEGQIESDLTTSVFVNGNEQVRSRVLQLPNALEDMSRTIFVQVQDAKTAIDVRSAIATDGTTSALAKLTVVIYKVAPLPVIRTRHPSGRRNLRKSVSKARKKPITGRL